MALRHLVRASAVILFLVSAGAVNVANAQNWDGSGLIRFGVFLQGSWLDLSARQTPAVGDPFSQSASMDGIGGGVSAGYDLRFGHMLLGIETDLALDDSSTKRGFGLDQYGVDYLATVRGRLGFFVHPSLLIYGTSGLALLGAEYKFANNNTKKNATMSGWTIGGGLEYDFGQMILFGEYLYNDFETWNFQNFNGNRFDIDAEGSVARIGVKFKVGHDHAHDRYPVVTRPMK